MVRNARRSVIEEAPTLDKDTPEEEKEVLIDNLTYPTDISNPFHIGYYKDPESPTFECIAGGNVFATGKALSAIKVEDKWSLVLEHGVIDKFLLLKWIKPRSLKDIVGSIDCSKAPTFELGFPFEEHTIKRLSDNPTLKDPLSYQFTGCVIKEINLTLLPGTHLAFTHARIEASSLVLSQVKSYAKEIIKESELSTHHQVDFY